MAGTRSHSGPKRKPSAIKRAEGNRSKLGKNRIKDDVRGKGQPACPLYLTAEHRKKWALTLDALPDGVFSQANSAVLESFTIAWQLVEESATTIIKTGKLIQGPNGPIHNPHLSILFRAQRELRAAGAELGLSPTARARLIAVPDFSDDPMAMLLGNGDPSSQWAS